MGLTWLKFSAGSTYALSINWTLQDGAAADLTGATLSGYLYATRGESVDSDNAIATLPHTGSDGDTSLLTFAAAATAGWQAPVAPWFRATAALASGVTREVFGRLWLDPFVETPRLEAGDVLVDGLAVISVATLTVESILNRPLLTGYVGGTATDLDAIATADLATGTIVVLTISGNLQLWQLQAGAPAASGSAPYAVVEPTDYDASTNARRWVLT